MPRYSVPTQIPLAVQNGTVYLECVIQDPPVVSASASSAGLAVVAHPLGRLGGSLDDPVVTHLSALLLTRYSLRVVRFNSRGVGKSTGSASWTGSSESSDFQEVLDTCISNYCLDFPNATHTRLVIAGYSAGSLYASTVKMYNQLREREQFRQGPRPKYILVSFPAGVQWALTLFSTRTFADAFRALLSSSNTTTVEEGSPTTIPEETTHSPPPSTESQPVQSRSAPLPSHVLAVYGDADQFTSLQTYRTWASQCATVAPPPSPNSEELPIPLRSTFHSEVIEGADHFYRKRGSLDRLDDVVISWMDRLKD